MLWKEAKKEEHACCEVPAPANGSDPAAACSDEICAAPAAETDPALCPVSRTTGLKVDLITVKALLSGEGLRRLDGKAYRFCPAADCDVVYFDNAAGSLFRKGDLAVRVGQKEKTDPVPICYCFGYTVADVRRDFAVFGRTEIPAIITAEVKAGHCACEVKNPQGSCCLGNVSKAVQKLQAELSEVSR